MTSMHDSRTSNTGEPVISVIKITIDAVDAPDLLTEAIEVLAAEREDLHGFLTGQILLSVDGARGPAGHERVNLGRALRCTDADGSQREDHTGDEIFHEERALPTKPFSFF